MIYKKKKIKIFMSFFVVAMILLSSFMTLFNEDAYYAATVYKTETTKKKTVGHKMEGAEYYEELWDKFSVIAADNGGGSGEGGGAGDNNASNAGNSGAYNDAGGIFGQAAGVGQGTGNTKNQSGTGSGSTGGSTGSVTADAYRKLKSDIEESRAESLAKVLETAKNAESVAASIAARESEQASIQKRLRQESIRASIEAEELQRQRIFETPVYVEPQVRNNTYVADIETRAPTMARRDSYGAYDNKIPPSRSRTTPRTKEVEQPKSNIIVREETIAPNANDVTYYDLNSISPSVNEIAVNQYDNNVMVPLPTEVVEYQENNEANIPTGASQVVENDINAPTSALEQINTEIVETVATLETFDSPIMKEETSIIVEEEIMTETYISQTETQQYSDEENGKGSKGGQDEEADEDMIGNDGQNESQGNADERGKYQLETEGEYAGKKIFELKQNGNIGFEPEHLSVAGLKNFMMSGITLLLMVGALLFIVGSEDNKRKNNYF